MRLQTLNPAPYNKRYFQTANRSQNSLETSSLSTTRMRMKYVSRDKEPSLIRTGTIKHFAFTTDFSSYTIARSLRPRAKPDLEIESWSSDGGHGVRFNYEIGSCVIIARSHHARKFLRADSIKRIDISRESSRVTLFLGDGLDLSKGDPDYGLIGKMIRFLETIG